MAGNIVHCKKGIKEIENKTFSSPSVWYVLLHFFIYYSLESLLWGWYIFYRRACVSLLVQGSLNTAPYPRT